MLTTDSASTAGPATAPAHPPNVAKRGRGRPRKHPVERASKELLTLSGKRALSPADLELSYGITRSILRDIPRSELPRVEINTRVHLFLAEDIESYLMKRRVQ